MAVEVSVLPLQATEGVKDGNVSCEVPPFSICFYYYFHTIGVL